MDLPLFGELGQTSQDFCGSISDSRKSWDVCLNSSKSCFLKSYILGFAFKGKPETSDMRDSPSIDMVKELKKLGKEEK